MFDILLESRPSPLGLPRWGIVLAVGLHAAAIATALRTPTRAQAEPPIIFMEGFPRYAAPRVNGGGSTQLVLSPLHHEISVLPLPPVEPIPGLPNLAEAAPAGPGGGVDMPLDPGATDGGALLPESLVQERPELLAGPTPVYPPALRDAGAEGIVVVQVVVDTLGRPEPGSARIVQHAAPGFEASAVSAILAARFRPARVWGRGVRVLVQVPVEFRLRSPR